LLTTVFALLVVLSVLIFVHELGHYVAAKSVGIGVPRFSIGMGPRVTGFHAWGTEWIISAIPLGGYVKLEGMEDDPLAGGEGDEGSVGPVEDHEPPPSSFDSKPIWARAWVISAGVIFNLIFAALLHAGLFFVGGEAIDPNTSIAILEREELTGIAEPLAEIPDGAELVAVGEHRVETWNEVFDAFRSASPGSTVLRFADAEPVVVQLPQGDSDRFALFASITQYIEPVVGEVVAGSPAAEVGLQPGDRIIEAGGQEVRVWGELVRIIEAHPGEPLDLVVDRAGETLALTVTPDIDTRLDERTRRVPIGRIGVGVEVSEREVRRYGPVGALSRGGEQTWEQSGMVFGFLRNLVAGHESPRDLGGPLAIAQISGDRLRVGWDSLIWFMAFFSVNLAILNLLPIPVLDGGHLLFLGLEAVRGRPLSVEQRIRLSHLGLIFVVGLMVWVITNDFLRFFGI